LAALRQEQSISQLASQFKVHSIVISRWKTQLLENAEVIFKDGRVKKKSADPNIDELYQEIGRLKVELDWLKNKSAVFD
jgi:transposase-like protein